MHQVYSVVQISLGRNSTAVLKVLFATLPHALGLIIPFLLSITAYFAEIAGGIVFEIQP